MERNRITDTSGWYTKSKPPPPSGGRRNENRKMVVRHTQSRISCHNGFFMFKCNTVFITVLVLFSSRFRVNVSLSVCSTSYVCLCSTTWNESIIIEEIPSLCLITSCIVSLKPPSCCPEGPILASHLPRRAIFDLSACPDKQRHLHELWCMFSQVKLRNAPEKPWRVHIKWRCSLSFFSRFHEGSVVHKVTLGYMCDTKTPRSKMCCLKISPIYVLNRWHILFLQPVLISLWELWVALGLFLQLLDWCELCCVLSPRPAANSSALELSDRSEH